MSKQLPNLLPRSKPLGSSQKLDEEPQGSNLPDLKPVGYEPYIAQNEPENLWEDEIRRNLRQSEGLTLDQIIKDKQASGQLNLDNALIERNRDDAYKIAGREEAVKKLHNAPGTRNYAAKGRTQAAIVKQDMDQLIKQEQNWTSGPGGTLGFGGVEIPGKETGHDRFKKAHTAEVGSEMWEQTKLGGYHLGQMMADAPAFVYDIFATPQNLLAEATGMSGLKTSSDRLGDILGIESNVVSDYYKQEAQKAEQYISQINPKYRQGIIDSFKEGDLDTGFRNLAGGILSSLQPSIAIMGSGGTLGAPGTIASGTILFGAGKKAELDEYSQMPEWKKGVVAASHGALEGLWETALGAGAIGKAFRNSIVKGFQRGGQEVAEKQGKKFLWDTWSKVIEKNPALIPLGEGFEEWGTQISQNAVDKYVGDRPDISLTEGAGDAMLVGIGMGTGFSGGMYGLQSALRAEEASPDMRQENAERVKLARIIEERNRADYSEQEQAALDTFRQTALESEVKKADPDTFQEITAEQLKAAEGKAPDKVFVSGDALVEAINSDPENVSPALEKVGVTQSEIQEAHKSGGDVSIPMSQYLAHIVGTEADTAIEPHVRLSPRSMSRSEREEWEQNYSEDAKRIIEEAGEAREKDYQIDADASRIEQAIENEIDVAGDPATRNVIQANARTWSSFFATMAKRGYLDNAKYQGSAWEAFKDFWPEVRKADPGDKARDDFERELNNEGVEALQQRSGTQFAQNVSENFRDWFGKSMIKTAEGQPIPLHHGTTVDFEVFEDRSGENTGHTISGLGHFFTLRKSEAKHYAGEDGRVVTAYVKMEQPYQMSLDEAQSFETVEDSRAFREDLQAQGYDSVVIKEPGIPPMFVPFSSNQIKSVDNTGEYGVETDNIYHQDGQLKTDEIDLINPRGTLGSGVKLKLAPREGPAEIKIIDGEAVLFADPILEGARTDIENIILPRAVERFLSPLAEDEYVRVTNNKKDYEYLQKGEHQGSKNHAINKEEYGLSVAKDPEFPTDYAYLVKGEKIADGTDGEPILDVATSSPVSKLMKYDEFIEWFEQESERRRKELGLSKKAVKQLNLATYDTSETFDPNDPRIMYQSGQTAPIFYSQLQDVLDTKLPGKGTAGQYLQTIQSWAKKGQFKREELEWSGVEEWLGSMGKKEKLTKEQVLDYLRANEIQIKEVSKSLDRYMEDEISEIIAESKFQSQSDFEDFYGSEEWAEMAEPHLDNFWSSMSNIEKSAFEDYADFKEDYGLKYDMSDIFPQSVFEQAYSDFRDIFSTQEEAVEQLDIDTSDRDDTKFSEYQLPGGENYKELLLMLPNIGATNTVVEKDGRFLVVDPSGNPVGPFRNGKPVTYETRQLAEQAATEKNQGQEGFRSSHWSEPNVLAHVRFNERTDADGNRVLFIEEVQSDWHQEGRKKGYQGDFSALEKDILGAAKKNGASINQVQEAIDHLKEEPLDTEERPTMWAWERLIKATQGANIDLNRFHDIKDNGVPDAPFKTTWPLLAMKRMIRFASENGFDKIAWTPGEMQAERYDLSRQVDKITWNEQTGEMAIRRKGMPADVQQERIPETVSRDKLPDMIGKEASEKMLSQDPNQFGWRTLEGENLRVGGQGMRAFYDKMLPSTLNKYVKKWGAKVGQTEIANITAHSIPVTDQMRDAALQGQPLFQGETAPKGAVQFGTPSGQPLINLFEQADESTFLHESGHVFLEFVKHIAGQEGATPDLVQMWQDIGLEIGHDPGAERISTEAHEKWAQSLEMYFREGHAPSTRLARAFQEFAAWLRRIYSTFTSQKSKPSPELKALFDRLFATDAEISEVEAQNEAATSLFDLESLESNTKQEYQGKRNQAEAQSRDEALKSYTRAYLRAQGGKKQAEAQARQEANNRPEYEASAEAVNMGGLNAELVREAVGEEAYKALLKKRVGLVTRKGTVSPQTMADKYGYEDAATFLQTLQQVPSKTGFIKSRTEKIIQEHTEKAREEFDSSGLTPAQAAYHNDGQFKALLTELDVIRGQTGGQVVSEETVRNAAKRILVEKEDIHNVDLQQFALQEAEAGRKAKKAVTQENWEEAELWKTRQAINHAVILETRAARDGKTLLSRELLDTTKDGLATSREAKEALDRIQKKAPPKQEKFIEADQALNEVLQDEKADIYAKQKALEKHIREFLPQQERSRVMHHIKNIAKGKSEPGRQGLLEYAMLKVEQAHQRQARAAALAKIDKLLKQKKPKRTKRGTQDNRRMGAEANKMIDLIRKARVLDQDQAMERATSILEKLENGREAVSDEEINQLIIYQTFGGLESRGVVDAQKALDALQEVISTGRASWQAKETARKEQNRKNREQFLREVTGGEGYKTQEQERLDSQKGFFRKMADNIRSFDDLSQSFEMLLDKLARKDIESAPMQSPTTDYFRRSVLRATIREHAQTTARQEQLRKKMEEIFGKKGLSRTLRKNTQVAENTGVTRKTESGRVEIPLSQNQAYKLWQLFQQPSILDELADHGYDSETLEQVNKFMTPEVKQWARWQIERFYPEYREGINDVYKELFYIEMPKIDGYSPVARVYEGGDKQDNEFLGERQGYLSSVLGSAVKTRVKNSRGFNLLDGDSVLFQHITQMEHFKAWGVPLQEMRSVLGAENVTAAIRQHHGKTANVALQSFLDRFATGGQERALMLGVLDKFRRNFTLSAIGGNPVVFAKQIASIPAYAMEIPTNNFAAGFMQALANPIKAYRTLMQSEAMQARYTSGWDRDIMLAMREANFQGKGKIQSFAEAMMISTKLGDKLAIVAGGYSVFQYHYKKMLNEGRSEQEAKTEALHQFDIATKRSQQAGDVMDLSYFQGALGSLGKLFTMFMTAPLSYYRNSASALRNLASGRGSKSENIKRLAVSWVVLQSVFQFIASGFEWEDDKQLRAALLGPLNGLFILRDVTDSLAGALIEGRSPYFSVGTPPPLTTISKASRGLAGIHKLVEEGGDTDDVIKIIDYLAESVGHLTGIPYGPMSRVYSGVSDAVTGETDYPIRRMMGYSEKSLKEANE